MRITILFFSLLLITISCGEEVDPDEGTTLQFFPRQCNFAWLNFVKQTKVEPDGQVGYILEEILDDRCKIEDIRLLLFTSNIDTLPDDGSYSALSGPYAFQQYIEEEYQDLDEHNTSLEKQLKDDYFNASKSIGKSTYINEYLLPWEYRTTGINELTITCNRTIFLQPSGASLNSYFHIVNLDPHQIISSDTKELIFGCSDNLNQMSIEEWLDMKPQAQPSMHLMMNDIPDELPGFFSFTIKLKLLPV